MIWPLTWLRLAYYDEEPEEDGDDDEERAADSWALELLTGRSNPEVVSADGTASAGADLSDWLQRSRPVQGSYVFPGVNGARWTKPAYQSWRRRAFDRAAAAAGVPQATPYSLRHSFCSLLLAEGRSVIEVARQLGHGANLTLGIYGHVIDELAGLDRVDAEAVIWAARGETDVPVSYLSALPPSPAKHPSSRGTGS